VAGPGVALDLIRDDALDLAKSFLIRDHLGNGERPVGIPARADTARDVVVLPQLLVQHRDHVADIV